MWLCARDQRRLRSNKCSPCSFSQSDTLDGWFLFQIHSSFDDDTGAVRYSISGKGAGTLFRIDAIKGHLTATHKLDREVESSYSLVVRCIKMVPATKKLRFRKTNATVLTLGPGSFSNLAPDQFQVVICLSLEAQWTLSASENVCRRYSPKPINDVILPGFCEVHFYRAVNPERGHDWTNL